jgi:hypothetical protein
MLGESFGFAIIPVSLGVSGIIFLCIALFLKYKYSYKGGVKSVGTLIGFRKLDNDHYFGALTTASGRGKYEDFTRNVLNSKPILRFTVNGREIECHSEWSVGDLNKSDIGRTLSIRYFSNGRGSYRVILEGKQYEQQRNRGQKIIFWIFAGIGIALVVVAVLAIKTFG